VSIAHPALRHVRETRGADTVLRFYLAVALAAYRRQLIYRWANISGLATNTFFGIVVSSIYIALYQAQPHAGGYDIHQTLTYIWLVQASHMLILPFGWFDLMLSIRSGDVVADLSKPFDFFWYWFARESGRNVYFTLFRGVPTYLMGALIYHLGVPSIGYLALFAAALLLAATLGIAYRYLYNVVAFWVIEGRAWGGIAQVVAMFMGGSYVPIMLFPPVLRVVVQWTPFAALYNVTGQAFSGRLVGYTPLSALGMQAGWALVFLIGARLITRAATRRVITQGG
jgi:ABC-2 type transport system permease protein